MSNRLSHIPIEVLSVAVSAPAELSQNPVEVLVVSTVPIQLRLSQIPVEVMSLAVSTNAGQISQLPRELLVQSPPAGAALLSQGPIEILLSDTAVETTQIFVVMF